MNLRQSRVCVRCIMDTTDPDITFDAQGVCNHCQRYDRIATRFKRETHVITLILDILAQEVYSIAHPLDTIQRILGTVGFCAFTSAPEDINFRA